MKDTQRSPKPHEIIITLAVFVVVFLVGFYWPSDDKDHTEVVETKLLNKGKNVGDNKYAGKISAYALSTYTIEKGYPKIVAKYGARLIEIESLRRKAAEMAIDSGKCDIANMSELSDKSDLQHLKFWVDCENGQRIYLDEFEINKNSPVSTQQDKSWNQDTALAACKSAIKERTLMPSDVDIHSILGASFYRAPVTQNLVLQMDFDAKNALGTEIPYTATCYFAPGEVGTIEIQARQ